MNTLDVILSDVKAEIEDATREFGRFNSLHEGYAVILEEMDELWTSVKSNGRDTLIR